MPERFLPTIPVPTYPEPIGRSTLLKVIASAVILAILGILFIAYNQHDSWMVGFGWFLVAIGAFVAGVFTYLLVKVEPPEPEPKRRRRRRK